MDKVREAVKKSMDLSIFVEWDCLKKVDFPLGSENAEEMALWRRGALLATEQLTFTMYKKD